MNTRQALANAASPTLQMPSSASHCPPRRARSSNFGPRTAHINRHSYGIQRVACSRRRHPTRNCKQRRSGRAQKHTAPTLLLLLLLRLLPLLQLLLLPLLLLLVNTLLLMLLLLRVS